MSKDRQQSGSVRAIRAVTHALDFLTFADAVQDMIWTALPDGSTEFCNRRWFEYTGLTPEATYGARGAADAVHPDDREDNRKRWLAAIESGEAFELECRFRQASSGTYAWFLGRVTPLRDEAGRVIQWIAIATEIDRQRRALERSQEIVDALQVALIPQSLPDTNVASFDALYVPADNEARVGGDWYDAFELPDGNYGFSLGDVAGHGLPAAVVMGQVRQAILTAAFDRRDPGVVLSRVNNILHYQGSPMVTAVVGFIYPRAKRIVFASAGHPSPIYAHREHGARPLEGSGLPLAVQEDETYENYALNIESGGLLLCYSDGILEYDRDILKAESALLAAMALAADAPQVASALDILHATMGNSVSHDDIAMLLMRLKLE